MCFGPVSSTSKWYANYNASFPRSRRLDNARGDTAIFVIFCWSFPYRMKQRLHGLDLELFIKCGSQLILDKLVVPTMIYLFIVPSLLNLH
jgi:hypothetical protein